MTEAQARSGRKHPARRRRYTVPRPRCAGSGGPTSPAPLHGSTVCEEGGREERLAKTYRSIDSVQLLCQQSDPVLDGEHPPELHGASDGDADASSEAANRVVGDLRPVREVLQLHLGAYRELSETE